MNMSSAHRFQTVFRSRNLLQNLFPFVLQQTSTESKRSDVIANGIYSKCAADVDWRWVVMECQKLRQSQVLNTSLYVRDMGAVMTEYHLRVKRNYAAECNEWRVICILLSYLCRKRRPRTSTIAFVPVFFSTWKKKIIGRHQSGII